MIHDFDLDKRIMTMKKRINISLDEETILKLKELAEKSHRNVSQWVTDKVWEADEKDKEKSERK